MATTLNPDPTFLHLDRIVPAGDRITFLASARQTSAACPCCGKPASRIHSRYQRTAADLPWQGMAVRFVLTVRRFFCDNTECRRRIFTEPLPQVVSRYARKTVRLADALTELVYLVGGEAAARIARRFGLLVSADTLLRQLRGVPTITAPTPRVLGVDDFAFRKGQRYGTILVDLERRCPVDLLPDREPETLVKWLQAHPGVEIVSRDRGAAYVEGATKGAPQAVQVADRFHLVKNLGDALERLLLRHHKTLQAATQTPTSHLTPPSLPEPRPVPPSPGHLQDKITRRERRLARFEEIKRLLDAGHTQREVARRSGHSRKTVRKVAACDALPDIATRPKRRSKLTPFVALLRERWQEGCYNATELHRQICSLGFTGNVSAVQRFVQSWREKPGHRVNGRHPPPLPLSPRLCSWLLTNPGHPRVTDEQRACLRRLTESSPLLGSAQALALGFCRLVRNRGGPEGFAAWLEQVTKSEVAELKTFAKGLVQDRAAVEAALSSEWSNGQVEGQVNRLKYLKRSMYGRAGFDLLKARVLPVPTPKAT